MKDAVRRTSRMSDDGQTQSLDRVAQADRIALFAEFNSRRVLSHGVRNYVAALQDAGYFVVVLAARNEPGSIEGGELGEGTAVIVRPNTGYDFGSWSHGLTLHPAIARARHVVLTNDSILGPFGNLTPILRRAEECGADVWAATANRQIAPHLQSFLLMFNNGVLAEKPLQSFFQGVRPAPTKMDYVRRYEIGLSALLRDEGFSSFVEWLSPHWEREFDNRSLKDWRRLLADGFPFVKKMLVTDGGPQAEEVASYLMDHYGVDVEELL